MSARRVQNLVRIRDIQERVAKAEVGKAQLVHQAAQASERAVWDDLESTASRLATLTTGAALQMADHHVRSGVVLARRHRDDSDRAAVVVQDRMDLWSLAAQRLEAVERLFDRVSEREAAELEQMTTKELEDLTIARFIRARAS